MNGGFTIRQITAKEYGFKYRTNLVSGYLNGQRIRKKFRSREDALGELNRLQVAAANTDGDVRPVNTRLTPEQVAQAEAAFQRLAGKPMSAAVEWYISTYRPPTVEKLLSEAVTAFLVSKTPEVRAPMLNDYRKTLRALERAMPGRMTHTITTEELEVFMKTLGPSKKSWNNQRGNLHCFFAFAVDTKRRWATENPVKPIIKHTIARGLPQIESVTKIAELFKYLETYTGETGQKPAGFLLPYFCLATFAGVRPSIRDGEIRKIAESPDITKIVDVELGVIRILPTAAKTKDLRTTNIQPNLKAWLLKYPLDKYPLIPLGAELHVRAVRKKFGLTDDVLRHTFVSMFVAKFRSLDEAATQAGNSVDIIKKHYRNHVSEADAATFWNIVPAGS